MTPMTNAVRHALWVYQNRDRLSPERLREEGRKLAEHDVFSARRIAAFTGLSLRQTLQSVPPLEYTRGRLEPEALPHIVAICELRDRGEVDHNLIAAALAAGTSTYMLARLTGIPQRSVHRYGQKPTLAPVVSIDAHRERKRLDALREVAA